MQKPVIENIIEELNSTFGDHIDGWEKQYDFHIVTVNPAKWTAIIQHLYQSEEFRFRYLTTLCGIHYPDKPKPFCLMSQLHSLENNLRIRLKTYSAESNPEFDTLTGLFPGANWMEREAFDFYGFRFKGHPDLRRILNVDDMDYFPMRKEYPVEDKTRFDKDDTMFGRKKSHFDRKSLMEKKSEQ